MVQTKPNLRASARLAGRSASGVALVVFLLILFRHGWPPVNWFRPAAFAVICGSLYFCIFFPTWILAFRSGVPAQEVLEHISPGDGTQSAFSGFVAMEYFALMLNRTCVVFIAPEALYGWKATGLVAAGDPSYFEPYAQLLEDPKLMRDVAAVRKLANLKGGFVIPRREIASVEIVSKQKSGMVGIPHSGRIVVRLASGGKREFILLGTVNPDQIRRAILSS